MAVASWRAADPVLAAQAWARVTPGSALAHQAMLARMRLEHDRGRFAAAERLIIEAANDRRADGPHLRFLLVPIYSQLGRLREAERLIEDWWERLNQTGEGASERAIDLVRMHIELTFKPNRLDDVRAYLEQAAALAPDDDRVWLGRANLAMRTGACDEARSWLVACKGRRPDDGPVWSSWLGLGIATGQPELVREALAHLPAREIDQATWHRLQAWLAGRRGDVETERRELERAFEAQPADLKTLDRLAELSDQAGQPARAAELRRQKAEIHRLQRRYETLFDRKQPIRDAVEMAHIASQLGRAFEARVFLTIALAADPELRPTAPRPRAVAPACTTGRRPGAIAGRGPLELNVNRARREDRPARLRTGRRGSLGSSSSARPTACRRAGEPG